MREDSFLVSVLRILLYSDVGTRYLVVLLEPIIRSTIEDIGLNGPMEVKNVSEEILEKNSERLTKILSSFLDTFRGSPFKCPLSLREIFLMIQQAVDVKFNKDGILKAPLSLDIMFFKFICPTLIDPARFHIVEEEISTEVKPTLLTLSKILNDLALNNTDKPWGNHINTFILKNHESLVESLNTLTNKEHIEQHRLVLESSTKTITTSPVDQSKSRIALTELLETAVPPVASLNDMKELKYSKMAALKKLVARPDWKPFKKSKDYTMDWIREGPWIMTKTIMNVTAPIEWVAKNTIHLMQTKEVVGSSLLLTELLSDDPELIVGRCVTKPFYPLANRELVVATWTQVEREDLILQAGDNVPAGFIPKIPGTVMVKVGLGGFVYERDGFGTKITCVNSINGGDSLPKWAQKIFAKLMGRHGKHFRIHIEAVWRNPSLFSIPAVTSTSTSSPTSSSTSSPTSTPPATPKLKMSKGSLFSRKKERTDSGNDDSSDSSRGSVDTSPLSNSMSEKVQ
eukprot:TRINITY_DN1759_c0_g5_i1.p1 TRINITY_DN1759_c0_g5~~TRINITY_DN1759_c0_g5_i1.p1  ORF type:complete len:595 (+),score=133.07 TRINITY_DN1759_c0_g5_i1:247-1785(+)